MAKMRPITPPRFPHLAAEMARRGFTKRNLAPLVGCSESYLSRVIFGWEPGSPRVRAAIAAALAVPEATLFAEDDEAVTS